MILPASLGLSYGSSSGVNGDTKSGPLGDLYFAAPFAVGSGASSDSAQTGGAKQGNWIIAAVGVAVAVVLFIAVLARRK